MKQMHDVLKSTRNNFIGRLLFLSLLLLPVSLYSQGTVTGHVTDSGVILQGAKVRLEGTSYQTVTDREGRYRISNVPAGNYTLNVTYIGGDSASAAVTVPSSGEVKQDISISSEVVTMEEFIIESVAEGQARAINKQRAADTISSIVSADAIGRLPDKTVAEALSRVPGVTLQSDNGDASFVTVRGAEPRFNSITLNGQRLPAASSSSLDESNGNDNRAAALDAVSADLISGIEVIKALTPDMDADSVGGTVNLISRSAFDLEKSFFNGSAEYGTNDYGGGDRYALSANYGQRLGGSDGKMGFVVSANYSTEDRMQDDWKANYNGAVGSRGNFHRPPPDGVGIDIIDQFDIRRREITRERYGINVNLDYKADDRTSFFLKTYFNQFNDISQRARVRLDLGARIRGIDEDNSTSQILIAGDEDSARARVRHRLLDSDEERSVFGVHGGGKHEFEGFDLEYGISYYRSDFEGVRERSEFEVGRVNMDYYDRTDPYFPVFVMQPRNTDVDVFSDEGHESSNLRTFRTITADDYDENITMNIDVTKPFNFGEHPGSIKVGSKVILKDKAQRPDFHEYYYDSDSLAQSEFPEGIQINNYFDGGFQQDFGSLASHSAVKDFFNSNQNLFYEEFSVTSFYQTKIFSGEENIYAGYGMLTVDINKLRLIAGARVEVTDYNFNGFDVDQAAFGATALARVTPISGGDKYTNAYGYLIATYKVSDRFQVRASWTNTIARPDFEDLVPFMLFNFENEGDGSMDNPYALQRGTGDLRPMKSMNFDLSLEWYFESVGQFSVAGFYKDIEDFIFSTTFLDQLVIIEGEDPLYFNITEVQNGNSAELRGVEISWQQQFRFLPEPLDGFGISTNYTWTDAEAKTQSRDLNFLPGQSFGAFNFLAFYEKGRIAAQVGVNVSGKYVSSEDGAVGSSSQEEYGITDADEDFWVAEYTTVDAKISFSITENISIYFQGRNLNEGVKKEYQGNPSLPSRAQYNGASYIGGVKWNF